MPMDDNYSFISPEISDDVKSNRNVKDSVFRDLFSDKKYLFQLYQALHPEDTDTTIDDLVYVTLENVLVRDIYNDLGMRVGDRLLIMMEAQSTWTENIIIRSLLYVAKTIQDYLKQTEQSLFSTKLVEIPEIELYVLYTGDEKIEKDMISFSEEFCGGRQSALDVRVNVLTDGREGDIINQFVLFTKIINEQVKIHGRTRTAIRGAIRVCMDRNILKEYLASREREVIDIMFTLFDQEEVMADYIASERRDQAEKTAKEQAEKTAISLYGKGMSVEDIADSVSFSVKTVEKWLGLEPVA